MPKFVTRTLHIIAGPTAVGKTEYTLRLAERLDAEIVSCDASQVYRGMDIGTAKPSSDERGRVPHHLIDVCDVDEPFDVVRFDALARRAVEDICARRKGVIVAGGSGFYLKSFLVPVIDTVKVDPQVRADVGSLYEAEGRAGLLDALERLNPGGLEGLDIRNPRRLQRALERCIASGRTLRELRLEFEARPEPYAEFEKSLTLLDRSRDVLEGRIRQRTRAMLEAGLVQEVERLCSRGLERNPSAAAAIGYRETLAYLRGGLSRDALPEQIVANTLRLVKKQRTWFRTQIRPPDVVLHPDD